MIMFVLILLNLWLVFLLVKRCINLRIEPLLYDLARADSLNISKFLQEALVKKYRVKV